MSRIKVTGENSNDVNQDVNQMEQESTAEAATGSADSQLDQLARENADLKDRLLRSQAEFQNQRRRHEKDKLELSEYASLEAVRALLPIIDDFERALAVESADKEYVKGMELIYGRLFESLKKLGLEPIPSAGQPFDPHIHHAVEMFETSDAPDHTVLAEYQRGYNFKGRLLRAAMVKVAVTPTGK